MHQFPHLGNGFDNQMSVLGEFRRLNESMEVKLAAPYSQKNDSLSVNHRMYCPKWERPRQPSQESSRNPQSPGTATHISRFMWPRLHLAWPEILLLIYLITYSLPVAPPIRTSVPQGQGFLSILVTVVSPKPLAPGGSECSKEVKGSAVQLQLMGEETEPQMSKNLAKNTQ